jgi:hypothetical protein
MVTKIIIELIYCIICTIAVVFIAHIYIKSNKKHLDVVNSINFSIREFELISKNSELVCASMKSELKKYAEIIRTEAEKKRNAPSPIEIFAHGNQNMLNMIDVSLYKMSEDGDLFGYDSISETLRKNLVVFNDPAKFNAWREKYIKYKNQSQKQSGGPETGFDGTGSGDQNEEPSF